MIVHFFFYFINHILILQDLGDSFFDKIFLFFLCQFPLLYPFAVFLQFNRLHFQLLQLSSDVFVYLHHLLLQFLCVMLLFFLLLPFNRHLIIFCKLTDNLGLDLGFKLREVKGTCGRSSQILLITSSCLSSSWW